MVEEIERGGEERSRRERKLKEGPCEQEFVRLCRGVGCSSRCTTLTTRLSYPWGHSSCFLTVLSLPPTQSKMSGAATSAGASRFQSFMNHPAGPKTVFFWAPLMKWCLVIAGLKDLQRPADKLSVSQNVALAATGFIWVRYSFVITPVNPSLAAVNFFVGSSGLTQLYRIWDYRRKNPEVAVAAPVPT